MLNTEIATFSLSQCLIDQIKDILDESKHLTEQVYKIPLIAKTILCNAVHRKQSIQGGDIGVY